MSSITYEYRWTHPTTADVMGKLDVSHCWFCECVGKSRYRLWERNPNSVPGRKQLDQIGAHILAEYPRGDA